MKCQVLNAAYIHKSAAKNTLFIDGEFKERVANDRYKDVYNSLLPTLPSIKANYRLVCLLKSAAIYKLAVVTKCYNQQT